MKKNFPKIIIITFLSVFIIQMIGLIVLTIVPRETRAADETPIKFKMQVAIPGSDTFGSTTKDVEVKNITLGNYIVDIYKYAIGIVGILASIILMYGGVIWITAMGSAERISEAQSWIKAAITGTVLALSSYMILYIVNPDLVKFNALTINDIKTVGCCNDSESITKEACTNKNGTWKDGDCEAKEIWYYWMRINCTGGYYPANEENCNGTKNTATNGADKKTATGYDTGAICCAFSR